jgi:hypothetical protein
MHTSAPLQDQPERLPDSNPPFVMRLALAVLDKKTTNISVKNKTSKYFFMTLKPPYNILKINVFIIRLNIKRY